MRTMKKRIERTNFINYWGLYILHNGIWSCCCSTNCAARCICFSFPSQCEQQKIINERALMYTVRVWAMMPRLLNKTKWFVTEVIFFVHTILRRFFSVCEFFTVQKQQANNTGVGLSPGIVTSVLRWRRAMPSSELHSVFVSVTRNYWMTWDNICMPFLPSQP